MNTAAAGTAGVLLTADFGDVAVEVNIPVKSELEAALFEIISGIMLPALCIHRVAHDQNADAGNNDTYDHR